MDGPHRCRFREQITREVLNPLTDSRSTKSSTDGGIEFVNDLRTPLAAIG